MSEALGPLCQDSWEVLSAKLHNYISVKNFHGALEICPFMELAVIENLPEDHHDLAPQVLKDYEKFYFEYMSISIIVNDYNGARHLWRRVPPAIKRDNNDLSLLWNVGSLLMQQNVIGAHAVLNHGEWSPHADHQLIDLVRKYLHTFQWKLVSKAYSSIALIKLSELLSVTSEQTVEECKRLGWSIDDKGNAHPQYISDTIAEEQLRDSIGMIARLSENVALFEKKNLKVDLTGKST